MKATGRFNKITGQEIMEIEEHDIIWTEKEFHELSDNDKADFLSFIKVKFLSDHNNSQVAKYYNYYRDKNLGKI